MIEIIVTIEANKKAGTHYLPINAVTGSGLRGVFFDVLGRYDAERTTELHDMGGKQDPETGLPIPAPYVISPIVEDRKLTALRICLFDRAFRDLVLPAWEEVYEREDCLTIGKLSLIVSTITCKMAETYPRLAMLPPCYEAVVSFVTPTAFRFRPVKGSDVQNLLFPMTDRLFSRQSGPLRVWDFYAPHEMRTPNEWLTWATSNISIKSHELRTTSRRLRVQDSFVGFVGRVKFVANRHAPEIYLRRWHSLLHLGTYSGYGYKTTVGMGATRLLSVKVRN